jgi:hypothetical protein
MNPDCQDIAMSAMEEELARAIAMSLEGTQEAVAAQEEDTQEEVPMSLEVRHCTPLRGHPYE